MAKDPYSENPSFPPEDPYKKSERIFGNTEPSSDIRQFASFLRQMFVAAQQEGFSQQEAMQLVATVVAAGFHNGRHQ